MFFVTPYDNLQQSSSRKTLEKRQLIKTTHTTKNCLQKSILNYNNITKTKRQIKQLKYMREKYDKNIQEKRHPFNHYHRITSRCLFVWLRIVQLNNNKKKVLMTLRYYHVRMRHILWVSRKFMVLLFGN